MKSKNSQPPTILSGTEKNGMFHCWKVFICVNCYERKIMILKKLECKSKILLNATFVRQMIFFKKKKQKKKLPALKLNQSLTKWNFSDDRNISFKEKRAQLEITLKLLFQNFLPWLYHINSIMRTCKLHGIFINNVLYFSISQKLIIQLNVEMQTPSSSEQF